MGVLPIRFSHIKCNSKEYKWRTEQNELEKRNQQVAHPSAWIMIYTIFRSRFRL